MQLFHFDNGHAPRPLSTDDVIPQNGFIWFDAVREVDHDWLAQLKQLLGLSLHEEHIEDAANPNHPSYFDRTSNYEMLIVRSLAPELGEEHFSTRCTMFFLFANCLVSLRYSDSRSVKVVHRQLLEKGRRPPANPVYLMHMLLNNMVDRFLNLREPLSLKLNDWRDAMLDPRGGFSDWQELTRHATDLRRLEILCEQQADVMTEWRENSEWEFNEALKIRFNDLNEHLARIVRYASEQVREVESLVQLHFSIIANRTNEIVKVLTVLSAIFLPLTLIAGIFGMNFETFSLFKHSHGFFYAVLGMGALAAGLLIFFRIKKWF